jgi:type I restriction enzyme M protein
LRTPQEILDEIVALDAESAEILAGIGGIVWQLTGEKKHLMN